MAIAKMLKMRLVGISSEQDALLDAMQKTGAVELKDVTVAFDGEKKISDKAELDRKYERLNGALSFLAKEISADKKRLGEVQNDGFAVSYAEFSSIMKKEAELNDAVDGITAYYDEMQRIKAEKLAVRTEMNAYAPYVGLKRPFSFYADTKNAACRLGTVSDRNLARLSAELAPVLLTDLSVEAKNETSAVVCVVCHKDFAEEVDKILSACGFGACPFTSDETASAHNDRLKAKIAALSSEYEKCEDGVLGFSALVRDMKILGDRYAYEKEKLTAGDGFLRTGKTFTLEAFVPELNKQDVENAVNATTDAHYIEFYDIPEGEFAPTLMENKKVVKQFEFVTNLYSAPRYGTIDPNAVMTFFFCLFMGFIMGDWGYGIVMTAGGFLLAAKIGRDTGVRRLANVIAVGGVFTVLFGLLFDSFFGITLLKNLGIIAKPIMPDPIADNTSLAGINVPTLLLISLGMGVFQIMVSLFMKALAEFRDKKIWDGIFDGFVWIIFLGGLTLLVFDMTGVVSGFSTAAAVAMGVSVAVGALTAGRHEKGFGKFTKGFGAVYGIINYMSDILSYARLYGLMLSGAQIAQIVSSLSIGMMTSPAGIVFGSIVFLIGHAFNLAMGVLGAYIHDSRLQYVEFFSRFYEGDGELFAPLGSKFEHIYIA